MDHFNYIQQESRIPFIKPSTWEPKLNQISKNIQNLIRLNNTTVRTIKYQSNQKSNITVEQRKAINTLRNNKDIIIKPADKGSGIVIMDIQQYKLEALRQLNDTNYYIPLTQSLDQGTADLVNKIQLLTC